MEAFDGATEEEKEQCKEDTMQQLEMMARLYIHQNQDQLGIFTIVAEALGFKAYPGQSMLMNEDIVHFINDKNQLLEIIYNETPDSEDLEAIKGE